LFRSSLALEDRCGHSKLAETRHRMEEQSPITVKVYGTECYPEYPIGPVELYTVQVVSSRQRIGIEEVVFYPERGVFKKIVYHDAVSPNVDQICYRRATVMVSDIHCDIDIERILFDLLIRQGIFPDESIRAQIKDI